QGGTSTPVTIGPNDPPALTGFGVITINALPGLQNPNTLLPLSAEVTGLFQSLGPNLEGLYTTGSALVLTHLLTALSRLEIATTLSISDQMADLSARASGVAAYADQPRLTTSATDLAFQVSLDLVRDSLRVVAPPGQNPSVIQNFNAARG